MANRLRGYTGETLYTEPGPDRLEVPWSDWIISTDDEDRDLDTISGQLPDWDLEGWIANGAPVLLDHNSNDSLPIGSCIDLVSGQACLWTSGRKTYARVFHDLTTSIGRDAWSLVSKGLLNGASIGFLPTERVHRRTGRSVGRFESGHEGSFDIKKLEICELSLSPTPSNWRCTRVGKSKSSSQWLTRKSVTAQGKRAESHGNQMAAWYAIQRLEAKLDRIGKAVKAAATGPTDRISAMSNFPYLPGGR